MLMQYKQEMIYDAFINGIISPGIRQRLLEYHDFNLETAVEKAIEIMQKKYKCYSHSQKISQSNLFAATLHERN